MVRLLFGCLFALLASAASAQDAAKINSFRVFLIWEDTGLTTPASQRRKPGDPIVANDRKLGSATQSRVDIVLEGRATGNVDDMLEVTVRVDSGTMTTTNYSLPVGYFAKNRQIRSIIVTHLCNGFEVDAKVGNATRTLKVPLTCGG